MPLPWDKWPHVGVWMSLEILQKCRVFWMEMLALFLLSSHGWSLAHSDEW